MKSRTSMIVGAVILMTSGAFAESPARQQAGPGDTAAAVKKGFYVITYMRMIGLVPPSS